MTTIELQTPDLGQAHTYRNENVGKGRTGPDP